MELIFGILLGLIVYPFIVYPALLKVALLILPEKPCSVSSGRLPPISMMIIVRNGEAFIKSKIVNSLNLDYPENRLEIIIASDGSVDRTSQIVRSFNNRRIQFFDFPKHEGKISAINKILPACKGEILVFTDVSALLSQDVLKRMASALKDETVGGVCGKKIAGNGQTHLDRSQIGYGSYEDFIRNCESRISSIASNEGFLYAVKRCLVNTIPLGVTDDLYTAMSIIKQNKRFLFDPKATARIPLRAAGKKDELSRRRRIVGPSLTGIWQMKALLNPFKYGTYSWMLFSHKILRRLVPFFAAFLLFVNVMLIHENAFYFYFLMFQLLGYFLFFFLFLNLGPGVCKTLFKNRTLAAGYYFGLGNLGTLLGIIDLVRGKKYTKWEPVIKK